MKIVVDSLHFSRGIYALNTIAKGMLFIYSNLVLNKSIAVFVLFCFEVNQRTLCEIKSRGPSLPRRFYEFYPGQKNLRHFSMHNLKLVTFLTQRVCFEKS